jgi:3-hydroxybutyryl-CoA dehydratase
MTSITRSFEDLKVGMQDSMSKKITQELVNQFAEVSGDFNPVHVDKEYGKTSIFGDNIAHGMIGAAMISAVLGNKLPGVGSIYLSQDLKFRAPVYFGDVITAHVEITELDEEKKKIKLNAWCQNQDEKKVVSGTAHIYLNQ